MKLLVTGAAGFIGSQLWQALARRGDEVIGIDNINDYYDVRLKFGRLREAGFSLPEDSAEWGRELSSRRHPGCRFIRMSIEDKEALDRLFEKERFDKVVHLAAQVGVRYSVTHPYAYLQSNLCGFLNILEACRHSGVSHLVFASSSSVYGMNEKVPYSEEDRTDSPVSLYAASKKSNELMAHSYSRLYGISMTGLRFFTVYGPWGRPDMSPMLFAAALDEGRSIRVFNHGDMIRDFTYIDDIVRGTVRTIDETLIAGDCPHGVAYKIYNIGCSRPVRLLDFIRELEQAMGASAEKIYLPMQPGDVYQTCADVTRLEREAGYRPTVTLQEGIARFVAWYRSDRNPCRVR